MSELLSLLPEYGTAHLQLTLAALLLGGLVAIPTGIWVTRRKRFEPAVLGVASVLQTIPSLALLAFMVPLLAALGGFTASAFGIELRSIGFLPALLALTLYSVLPMLRNTVTGIEGVDPALVEAARGVGMTDAQQLWRVELPLALPVIVAGVRTATVWVVGTATLATPVGATSLGNYIFSGLQTRNFTAVVLGSVAAAGLALTLDGLIRLLERGVRERARGPVTTALVLLSALLVYAGATSAWSASRGGERAVAIGAKTFTEQYILAAMLSQQVTRETGRPTRTVESLGSTVAFDALRSGELDLYVDYSGTIWATIMKRDELPDDRAQVVRQVGEYLAAGPGIELVGALGFENTYVLGMREAQARELGVETIGQLSRHAPRLEIGGDYEFFARPEWVALRDTYGLRFRRRRSMDASLMYQAAAAGEVDVISAFSTDGRIAAFDLRLLKDDRGVIPPYDAIILASARLVREAPDVVEAVRALLGRIDEATMQQLNWAVDEQGRSPTAVARDFLAGLEEGGDGG
ncbi:MAG: ABC transporter permease/substrate-binding protein [Proteobacteria bacterium]|nr:ABC transporter permease/substrate-binding protein [Pseudomonadota bacterium]